MRRLFFALALFLPIAQTAFARTELPVAMEPNAHVKITVASCFNSLPPCGYAPVDVTINNSSGYDRSWTFQFTSPGSSYGASGSSIRYAARLAVQNNAERSFRLLVPLALRTENAYTPPLAVLVSGEGVRSGAAMLQFSMGNRTGKPLTAFVAMSEKLASRSWSQLDGGSAQLNGTVFPPDELPEDWRALAGISGIWLLDDELAKISPAQRVALRDWVSRGGSLFVYGATNLPPDFETTGLGRITVVPDRALRIDETKVAIGRLSPPLDAQLANDYLRNWGARKSVGAIKTNAPLLMVFMGLFAAVVGPMNLFLFARQEGRHRLFWTTPVISLAATALLFLLIVFQDGFGGSGERIAFVHLLPAEKKSVVLQEQVSRTGVLWSSAFATRDDAFIAPIKLDPGGYATTNLALENDGKNYAGDWFRSRSIQAQWIETIVPTRAGVALLNKADSGAAPTVVSSFAAALSELYFIDQSGVVWHAGNVRTGEKTALQKSAQLPELMPPEAGPALLAAWDCMKNRPACFYATSADSSALVDTLPTIRWKNDRVIYVGPITPATP